MQQVDMRHIRKRRRHTLKDEARLDERKVERLAVIGDDARDPLGEFGDRLEQRALGRKVGEEKLPQPERAAIEPATADEEGVTPCAAREPGGFEVQEKKFL